MSRKTLEERLRREKLLTVLCAVLAFAGAVFLTSLAFAGIATVIDLNDAAFTFMSSVSLCAGCFAAGFAAAKKRGRNGIKTGFLCGIAIFAVTFPLGLIIVKSFSAGGFLTKTLIILACSAIGGVCGVNARS